MDNSQVLDIMRAALMVGVKLCAPTLLISMIVGILTVSYTHLDVYKRQVQICQLLL